MKRDENVKNLTSNAGRLVDGWICARGHPDILFAQIRKELEGAGKFAQLREDYQHIYEINNYRLRRMLNRWDISDVTRLLNDAGFTVTSTSEDIYAGQSMLLSATKTA